MGLVEHRAGGTSVRGGRSSPQSKYGLTTTDVIVCGAESRSLRGSGRAEVVAVDRLAPVDPAADRPRVRVEQQLRRVAALPALRRVRAVRPEAVPLPRHDARQIRVPDERVALAQLDRRLRAVVVQQTQLDCGPRPRRTPRSWCRRRRTWHRADTPVPARPAWIRLFHFCSGAAAAPRHSSAERIEILPRTYGNFSYTEGFSRDPAQSVSNLSRCRIVLLVVLLEDGRGTDMHVTGREAGGKCAQSDAPPPGQGGGGRGHRG